MDTILCTLVAITVVITPLVMMPRTVDMYRLPKNIVFQTLTLIIFAVTVCSALVGAYPRRLSQVPRHAVYLAAGAVLWAAIVSIASINPAVSFFKPLSLFCLAVFFLATHLYAPWQHYAWTLALPLAPATMNAIVAIAQFLGVSQLIFIRNVDNARLRATALVGNPNEVGGYLVLPMIAAIAAAIAWPRFRWLFAAAAVIIAGGLLSAQSVTPVVATVSGLAAFALLPGARTVRLWGIVGVIVFASAIVLHPGSRARMLSLIEISKRGDLSETTSFRLPAFAVALRMFQDRPLLGVGPGVYSALYMDYKLRLDERHPDWIQLTNFNFGETHNDHLQFLAEAGIIGYFLFIGTLVAVARLSFAIRDHMTEEQRFVQRFAFPAAISWFVLSLAHFPGQVTSSSMLAVYFAGICFRRREGHESA